MKSKFDSVTCVVSQLIIKFNELFYIKSKNIRKITNSNFNLFTIVVS